MAIEQRLYFVLFITKLIAVATFKVESNKYPLVKLKDGFVRGFTWEVDDGQEFFAFQGIPYAKPPVAELRFKAPEPVSPWTGILNATYEGRMCLQDNPMLSFEMIGDEDCLYLNVYVPKTKGNSALPVVAFIHGGAFQYLSGSAGTAGPKKLLKFDIIFVSFNYRLGPLGFLSTGDEICPGNFGVLDQVLALKWINENIENFGGNKNDVTLLGESSGAMSVTIHLVSPLTKGLFHKVIFESGTILAPNMMDRNPLSKVNQLAKIMNCTTNNKEEMISCLKSISPLKLVFYGDKMVLPGKQGILPRFVPVVDNFLLPDHPENLLKNGNFHRVPVLSGTNENEIIGLYWADIFAKAPSGRDEMKFWLNSKFSIMNTFTSSIGDSVKLLKKFENEILQKDDFGNVESIRLKVTKFLTAAFFVAPQAKFIKYIWRQNPSYVYLFEYRAKVALLDFAWQIEDNHSVTHGDEVPFLFSGFWDLLKRPEEDRIFGNTLIQLFSNFIKFGNPSPNGLPLQWDPVTSDDIEYLQIAKTFTMKSKYQEKYVHYFNDILPLHESNNLKK